MAEQTQFISLCLTRFTQLMLEVLNILSFPSYSAPRREKVSSLDAIIKVIRDGPSAQTRTSSWCFHGKISGLKPMGMNVMLSVRAMARPPGLNFLLQMKERVTYLSFHLAIHMGSSSDDRGLIAHIVIQPVPTGRKDPASAPPKAISR